MREAFVKGLGATLGVFAGLVVIGIINKSVNKNDESNKEEES